MMPAQNYPGPARPSSRGAAWLPRAAWPLLLALLVLGASCQRQLNQRTGRYPSRSSARPSRPTGGRLGASRAPGVVKSKSKTLGSASGKTVVKQRMARPSSASGALATVIDAARSYQGTPYLYGGTTRGGLDCSGLLMLSFAEAGIAIPRSSNEQAVWGDPIKPTELRPGDLLFFGPSPGASTITHVGMVTVVDADGVEFIHASSSLGVVENAFELDYYLSRFVQAVRPRL